MKYGVHAGLWQAHEADEIIKVLGCVADNGFDGIEVPLHGLTDEKALALGKAIKEHGLEVTCTHGLSPDNDISSADKHIRQNALAHLGWAIQTASLIGSDLLCGPIFAPWKVFEPKDKTARAQRSADALGELDHDLHECNVTLGLEALNRFETDLVNTAEEATHLAKTTGSDRIGILLDTFHLNIEEKNIKTAITNASEKLVHFHISDNDRGVPGSGHVPWNDVKDALDEINYDGWIVAEMFVTANGPISADLNIWRDIEPNATHACKEALTFMKNTFG